MDIVLFVFIFIECSIYFLECEAVEHENGVAS